MAWIETRPLVEAGARVSENEKGHLEILTRYHVLWSTHWDQPDMSLAAPYIPARRSAYQFGNAINLDALCVKRAASVVEPGIHLVECSYSTDWLDASENPLDMAPSITWDRAMRQVGIDKDKDGKAIRNSAGDPFEDLVDEESYGCFTITRQQASFSSAWSDEYSNTVNNATWNGYPARTVKCSKIGASGPKYAMVSGSRLTYWTVALSFELNKATWDLKILDRGYRKLEGGVQKQIKIDNICVSTPKLLNGAGGLLAEGADAEYITKRRRLEKNFGTFNITL